MSKANVSNAEVLVRSAVCLAAGACVAAAAVRYVVYDIVLIEQLMRIAAGALR